MTAAERGAAGDGEGRGVEAIAEGIVLDIAMAIAEASDDGCFDPHRTSGGDEEDRAYWMRLARSAAAMLASDAGLGGDARAAVERVRAVIDRPLDGQVTPGSALHWRRMGYLDARDEVRTALDATTTGGGAA